MAPQALISIAELTALRDAWEKQGQKVAFVPTMGALHAGHLSLVDLARQKADCVLASIFVNPTQFGPNEDFERYPRTLRADLDLLASRGVEAVFLPNAAAMYPEGYQTYVRNTAMAEGLCGASRPGHFEGVLTVVLKLFNLVRPNVAVFGKKDYQQFKLIERMVRDLDLPIEIVGAETLREADGLAMSSRNRYLSQQERQMATALSRALMAARDGARGGKATVAGLLEAFNRVVKQVPQLALEYVEIRHRDSLRPFAADTLEGPAVMLCAGRLGSTRLIDNIEID